MRNYISESGKLRELFPTDIAPTTSASENSATSEITTVSAAEEFLLERLQPYVVKHHGDARTNIKRAEHPLLIPKRPVTPKLHQIVKIDDPQNPLCQMMWIANSKNFIGIPICADPFQTAADKLIERGLVMQEAPPEPFLPDGPYHNTFSRVLIAT